MADRPRFFDDLAGVAGGAMSALAGLRDEAEALVRARMDEAMRRFDLVKREELEAVQELAANARSGQEAAETELSVLRHRIGELEARLSALEARHAAPAAEASLSGASPSRPSPGETSSSASPLEGGDEASPPAPLAPT